MTFSSAQGDPGLLGDADLARAVAACARGLAQPPCPARDAEAELCRRYVRRLVAFGRRRLGSLDDARDLAQESLLLGLQSLRAGEVREPDKIGSFFLGVARSLSTTRMRKRSRVETFDPEERELAADAFELPAHSPATWSAAAWSSCRSASARYSSSASTPSAPVTRSPRLAADFDDVEKLRLDVDFQDLERKITVPLPSREVVVDRELGEVLLLFPGDTVRSYPRSSWTLRLHGQRPYAEGEETEAEIGPFVMDHTP